MNQVIEMPEVTKCDATKCAYNIGAVCHARGITIGDMQQHLCDTMWKSPHHTHRLEGAGVGACRSENCLHNVDLECQADKIDVTVSGGRAQCGTFTPR